MNEKDEQPTIKLTTLVAAALAGILAFGITSFFGIAGTMVGVAVYMVVITWGMTIFEVYLRRAERWFSGMRGDEWDRMVALLRWLRAALHRLPGRNSLAPRARTAAQAVRLPRGSFSGRSVVTGGAALALAFVVLTGVEAGAGKSLGCMLWDSCSPEQAEAVDFGGLTSIMSVGDRTQPPVLAANIALADEAPAVYGEPSGAGYAPEVNYATAVPPTAEYAGAQSVESQGVEVQVGSGAWQEGVPQESGGSLHYEGASPATERPLQDQATTPGGSADADDYYDPPAVVRSAEQPESTTAAR